MAISIVMVSITWGRMRMSISSVMGSITRRRGRMTINSVMVNQADNVKYRNLIHDKSESEQAEVNQCHISNITKLLIPGTTS